MTNHLCVAFITVLLVPLVLGANEDYLKADDYAGRQLENSDDGPRLSAQISMYLVFVEVWYILVFILCCNS